MTDHEDEETKTLTRRDTRDYSPGFQSSASSAGR